MSWVSDKLRPGMAVETKLPVLAGVSQEGLVLRVERSDADNPDRPTAPGYLVEFSVWYFDLRIGTWAVKVGADGGRTWIDVEASKRGRTH